MQTMPTDYTVRLTFGTLTVRANLAEASAPIQIVDAEGDATSTGYQTADARHEVREMARLAVLSCGRDYYLDPTGDVPADDASYVSGLVQSVTECTRS